jgi:SAM-dependent methyltransferase
MNETWQYYQREAVRYAAETVALDLSALHRRFTAQLYQGAYILDAGCGSGRDSLAFLQQGYRVHAFDASPEMARLASERLQQVVPVHDFGDLSDVSVYDGIWACASLLHVPVAELPAALGCLWRSLKPGGVMYLSFKHGHTERRAADGRHFSDANESRLRAWTKHLPELASVSCWLTQSARPGTHQEWLNALLFRQAIVPSRLVAVTASNPFLPQLSAAIAHADEIDFAVSFVKVSGLRLLMPDLRESAS